MTHLLDTSGALASLLNEPGEQRVKAILLDPSFTVGISALTLFEIDTAVFHHTDSRQAAKERRQPEPRVNFSSERGPRSVKRLEMRATVTLWTEGTDGEPVGVSEFVLYEPDEKGFLVRAKNLFVMVASPFMPLCARLLACGGSREIDATMADPMTVAERLWKAYCLLCPECQGPSSSLRSS